MKKYDHLREKAKILREKGHSLIEISHMLGKSKTTVYHWLINFDGYQSKILESHKSSASINGLKKAVKTRILKLKKLREIAYTDGKKLFLEDEKNLRDFALLYLTEGCRKEKWSPSISNSNWKIILFSKKVMEKYSNKKINYSIQYHVDQDFNSIKKFWSDKLNINPADIKLQRKSNSGKLTGRNWASVNGVMAIKVHDSYLREKIQAWMDLVEEDWETNFIVDNTAK